MKARIARARTGPVRHGEAVFLSVCNRFISVCKET